MQNHDATPSAPTEEEASDLDAKPPKYESIQQRTGQQNPYVHFSDDITQSMQTPMMTTNGVWYPQSNIFQHPPQATNPIFMSKEWIKEQKKNTQQMLDIVTAP